MGMNFNNRRVGTTYTSKTEVYLNGELLKDAKLEIYTQPILDKNDKLKYYKKIIKIETTQENRADFLKI